MSVTDIFQNEVDWLKEVNTIFSGEFTRAAARFKNPKTLLQRFNDAVSSVLSKGPSFSAAVDEAHNELCVASEILANPQLTLLEYEPPGCAKSIDFRARTDQGLTYHVDVKTINPKPKDRWDQYEKANKDNRFPENVSVILSEAGLGGERWHYMFASRARMLEYALEFEAKIRDCNLVKDDNTFFILAFCGEGFKWRPNNLEDFASFYRTGSHRADDQFSQMEAKSIADKNIRLDGTITSFASMTRPLYKIRHTRFEWKVKAPTP